MENYLNNKLNEMFSSSLKPALLYETSPKVDVIKTDNSTIYEIELPGFKKEDIEVKLQGERLILSAKKEFRDKKTDERGTVIHSERFSGKYFRTFLVEPTTTEEDISISFDNGILTISVKDKGKDKVLSKNIPIK